MSLNRRVAFYEGYVDFWRNLKHLNLCKKAEETVV